MEYFGCYMFFGLFFVFVVALMAFAYSRRLRCPLCRGEVEETERKVTFQPTKERPGLEKTTYKCRSCNNIFHRTKNLPQLGAFTAEIYGAQKEPGTSRSESAGWGGSSSYGGGWSSGSSGGWSSGGSSGGFGGGKSGGGGASSSF
jgi:uncharacterized membrane protein